MWKFLNYNLRPWKQVERKIIIEILNELRFMGYPISQYRYIGMPSIFYYDFILFYKYLYIQDMIGFESKPIKKRMEFSKPYDFIKIKNWEIWRSWCKSHFSKKVILWLDYISSLDRSKLDEISKIIPELKQGSIIMVTVSSEYPIKDIEKFNKKINQFGDFLTLDGGIDNIDQLNSKNLSSFYFWCLKTCIKSTLHTHKPDMGAEPLFNIEYKDWSQMASFGFIIDKQKKTKDIQNFLKKYKQDICSNISDTYKIDIPILTNKEKTYINKMQETLKEELKQTSPSLTTIFSQFEIDLDEIRSYLRHSKYDPNYFEWFV